MYKQSSRLTDKTSKRRDISRVIGMLFRNDLTSVYYVGAPCCGIRRALINERVHNSCYRLCVLYWCTPDLFKRYRDVVRARRDDGSVSKARTKRFKTYACLSKPYGRASMIRCGDIFMPSRLALSFKILYVAPSLYL